MGYLGHKPTPIPLTSADITDGTIALADMGTDSVDGTKIADDAINSEHYAAGSIDTAHIATNQIDETLIKDAFVGDFSDVTVTAADSFLYGDATDSGNTKKDTVQGILDLAGGAKLVPITQIASSNAGTAEFDSDDITSTYDIYLISMIGFVPAGDAGAINCRIAIGGTEQTATNYIYGMDGYKSSGSTMVGSNSGRSHWELIEKAGTGTGENMSGNIWLYEPLATSRYTTITWSVGGYTSIPDARIATGSGIYASTSAVNGIIFSSSAGNIAGCQWRLYGVSKT